MRLGGVVLCGGKSTRMGYAKAWLPFGGEVMLHRVVRILGQIASPVVVVAAPGQDLPELPPATRVALDEREGRGPMEGLRAGLTALRTTCDAAFVSSCDAPRLNTAFIQSLVVHLGEHQIAVPCEGEFCHPLAAVYRLNVLPWIEKLLAADRLRPAFLFDEVDTVRIPVDALRAADPELSALANINQPADYLEALAAEGLQADPELLAMLRPNDR